MNPKKYLQNWIRGWLPKEPALPSHQRIRATRTKSRKSVLALAFISVGVVATALLLAAVFQNPPQQLKQNLYTKSFDDLQGMFSFDVIIHYETEADGTWRRSDLAKYNITVLVKPTYVKESAISKVNVIRWTINGIDHALGGWEFLTEEPPPIDYGIELMGFWLNQSAWRVASQVFQAKWPSYAPREANATWTISSWFAIREILTNGTSRILNWGDSLFIYWSG